MYWLFINKHLGIFYAVDLLGKAYLVDKKTGETKYSFNIGGVDDMEYFIGNITKNNRVFCNKSVRVNSDELEHVLKYIDLKDGSVHEFGNAEYMYADGTDLFLYNYWATYKVDEKTMKITDTLHLPAPIFLMYDNYAFCHGIG